MPLAWRPTLAAGTCVPSKGALFGNRRIGIGIPLEAPIRQAYQLLGVRKKPSLNDYIIYLEELRADFADTSVPHAEAERLVELYRRLAHEIQKQEEPVPRFPLLTGDGKLLPPELVFDSDAPWFEERLDAGKISLLHRDLPSSVVRLPWVRSLAREIIEDPRDYWEQIDDQAVLARIKRLRTTIRSLEFRRGLLRLVAHENPTCAHEMSDWLARASVVAVREILTDLSLEFDGERMVVGSGKTNYYFDRDKHCFYLDGDAGNLMRLYVAQMINATLGAKVELSTLSEIVDCDPGEIEQTLTRLRIKPMKDEIEAEPWPDDVEDELTETPTENSDAEAIESAVGDSSDRDREGEESSEQPAAPGNGSRIPGKPRGESDNTQDDEDGTPDGARRFRPGSTKPGSARTSQEEGQPDDEEDAVPTGTPGGGTGFQDRNPPRSPPSDEPGKQDAGRSSPREKGRRRTTEDQLRHRQHGDDHPKDGQGSAERPIQMRPSGRRKRRLGRRRDRVATYVSGALPPDGQPPREEMTDEERRRKVELGREAVKRVCIFEESHQRKPVPRSQTHPGYDVDSWNPIVESAETNGGADRTIEVKGLAGPWTEQGVGLTPRQFQSARELGDRFWLYVVEYAEDPTRAVVHPIQNPFGKVTGYWFDRGWKQLADAKEAPSREGALSVGQRISVAGQGEGTIIEVLHRGALRVLGIQFDNGRKIKRPFNPMTMQVK